MNSCKVLSVMAAKLSMAVFLLGYAAIGQAVSLRLIALAPYQAEFQIDGTTVRSMRPGTTSPEGIRLISANSNYAEVEVDRQVHRLALGQRVESGVELKADSRGHFLTDITINGQTTRALVDTGATTIALSQFEAERLGLQYRNGTVVNIKTAAGEARGYLITLDYVQLGPIVLKQVQATISMLPNSPPVTLIGMAFLQRLEISSTGDRLRLTPRK